MPGIEVVGNLVTRGNPVIQGSNFPLGANLDGSASTKPMIFAGDFVVQTTNSTYRGPNDPSVSPLVKNVRPLLQADATALYGSAALAAPSAPTITKVATGGVLPSGHTYYAVVTFVSPTGETVASAVSNQVTTASATDSIVVTAPTIPAGAIGYKVYAGLPDGANTGPFYLVSGTIGGGVNFVIQDVPLNTEPTPPTGNTTGGIAGVLGVSIWDAATDVNGLAVIRVVPAGVSPITPAIYSLPSVATSYPPLVDPVTNSIVHSRLNVALAGNANLFKGRLNQSGGGAHVGVLGLIGAQAGIVVNNTGAVPYSNTYLVDTSLTGGAACLEITALDETDPLNQKVYFKFLPGYDQFSTGIPYSAN
jgi:hypothetical protein